MATRVKLVKAGYLIGVAPTSLGKFWAQNSRLRRELRAAFATGDFSRYPCHITTLRDLDCVAGLGVLAMTSRAEQGIQGKATNKRSLEYVLKSGLAGGLAGCAAKTLVAPLDRVKILFQTSTPAYVEYIGSWKGFVSALTSISSHEGLRGLFKGHSATLLQKFPYAAINFLMYEQMRALFISSPEKETPLRRFLSGSVSGATSVFFTYPLDLIRVRLAIESRSHRSSLKSICRQIYNEQSGALQSHTTAARGVSKTLSSAIEKALPISKLSNFYRGFTPTMLGMLPYAGMSFFTHDTVKDWLRRAEFEKYTTVQKSAADRGSQHRPLKIGAQLIAGALAGTIAQTASYPFEVIRRRVQASGVMQGESNIGIAKTCHRIWSERGFRGFWVGLTIGYIKVVPMVAASFLVYEQLKYQFNI